MKRWFLCVAWMTLCFGATVSTSSESKIAPADYARANAVMVEAHTLPRYEKLHLATDMFAITARAFCIRPGEELSTLRSSYHDLMDAWMGIQHVRFGPVEYHMRSFRFYFWPQGRGKVSDAVANAVADDDLLFSTGFSQTNVVVQGLMAAEVLLFDEKYLATDGRACTLLRAVSENMKTMAAEILTEWRMGDDAFAWMIRNPGPDNPFFENHVEGTFAYFQGLLDSLELIHDINLKAVIGDDAGSVRPAMAESRWSGRSQRNTVVSLEALQSLYGTAALGELTARVAPDLDRLLRKAFRLTVAAAQDVGLPVEEAAADPLLRLRLATLSLRVRALHQILRDRLAPALGFTIGFNSLDGD